MKNASAPPYRRHKSRGRDRAYVELDGKRVYLGPWNTPASRQRYDQVVAEYLGNCRQVERPEQGPTVSELIVRFWHFAKGYYRKPDGSPTGTLDDYRVALRPLRRLYGPTPAAAFGPNRLRAIRETWIRDGLSRNTVNQYTACVKRVFKWATSHEHVSSSVHLTLSTVEGLRLGRTDARETVRVHPAPAAHVRAVRWHVSPQVWAMIQLQRLTGMRPGEVVQMRAIDVDTRGKVWVYSPPRHKLEHHGHARTIYLGPKAQTILQPFLRPELTVPLFSPQDAGRDRAAKARTHRRFGQAPSPRRTDRRLRDCYDVASYRRAIERACKAAGVCTWKPNQLRHNAATRLRREYGIDLAQTILGHRLGSAITEIYAEANVRKAIEVVGQVG